MTNSGDEGGFHPHPGDPWHPGWTEESVPDAAAPSDVEAVEPPSSKRRRGLFRRRPKDAAVEIPGEFELPEEASDLPPVSGDEEVVGEPGDMPAALIAGSEADLGAGDVPSVPSVEPDPVDEAAPLPAWLSDTPPDDQKDPTLTVELPSWVGETTVGADGVVAGFEDALLPDEAHDGPEEHPDDDAGAPVPSLAESDAAGLDVTAAADEVLDHVPDVVPDLVEYDASPEVAPAMQAGDDEAAGTLQLPGFDDVTTDDGEEGDVGIPPAEDLEVALRALGALDDDDDDVEVVAVEAGLESAALDPSPEEAAASSEYGVAGKEAFQALRGIDQEDLGEWEDFVSTAPAAERALHDETVVRASEEPQPEAFDEWVVEEEVEEPKRRGIWPFRRRRDREVEDGYDAEWAGDVDMIPEDAFAEIDEDAVVPPPANLPETEWPEPEPRYESQPEYASASDGGHDAEPELRHESGQEYASAFDAGYAAEPDPVGAADEPEAIGAVIEEAVGTAADAGGWEVPVGAHGRFDDPDLSEPDGEADDFPMRDATLPAAHLSAEEPDEVYEPAFDHGSGFESIPELEDDALFRPPGDRDAPPIWPREPVTVPEATASDDGDEWVTGPIDLGGEYEDATVELPGPYASVDDITEQIYTTSVTTEHRGFAAELDRFEEADTEWQAISAAMPGVGTGVVGFDDVADLGDDEDVYQAPSRSELGTRVLTGIVLVGFLLGTVWVGGGAAAAFIGLLVALGLGEFYGTLRHRGFRPLALFGYVGGIGLYAATWFHGPIAIPVGVGLTAVMVFFVYAFAPTRRDALTNGGLTLLGIAWVMGTAAFAVPILRSPDYRELLLAVVVVTAAMDIGAYSVGRTWGRRALAPVLSPNKSVEGLIGGIVTCLGVAAAVGSFIDPFDLRSGLALGAVICVAAPIGDLAESMIKRSLGVKDMGAILPGHGGILDRIDAFLFVIPAAWVLFTINGLLG